MQTTQAKTTQLTSAETQPEDIVGEEVARLHLLKLQQQYGEVWSGKKPRHKKPKRN